ncbi:nuclear transport factor 2 family protein [Hymenobacter sp. BT664]|uniref:Nuclear transport factor 2 family protein n=1 Tax=Hymenobacter montanus TaxID=2771359 RepID=A0A927GIV6_9BACT|nr:nuclear transport factor 2 family protein [Hymenobacter montanus]MBD2767471.1 nuclear transport factor 2 family protein [Hymenobacter montanus]
MKNYLTVWAILAWSTPFVTHAQTAREAMLAAETSFAEAAKEGTRAAFLANCAPTAFVSDNGALADAHQVWSARPTQANTHMAWYPVLADVAQSGDLGYTTGPWASFQNNRPQTEGEYVTVWRKQPDGHWKYVVDMSVERIGKAAPKMPVVPQPHLSAAVATPSAAPSSVLLDLDGKFTEAELLKPGATYEQYLSTEARLYRSGVSTMQGETAIANMKNLNGRYFFAATSGYLAAAGDLGYVVGTMRRPAEGRIPEEQGSYLRIWRREAVAGWRIVVEVLNFTTKPTPMANDGAATVSQPLTRRPQ